MKSEILPEKAKYRKLSGPDNITMDTLGEWGIDRISTELFAHYYTSVFEKEEMPKEL